MKANPYLLFSGQCKAAMEFYAGILGGKIEAMLPHAGTPAEEHVAPDWRDKIMHAHLVAGDVVLMGSDVPPAQFEKPQGMSVSLHTKDIEESERIFKALSQNAQRITMPIAQTFWSVRFGMLTDRFGIPWMINCVQDK